MGGINFTRLSQSDLGIRFGLNLGILRSKFATPNGAYPKIWGPMIGYSSLSIEGVKKFKIGKPAFEVFGGGDLRYYQNKTHSSYGFRTQPTTSVSVNEYEIVVPPFDNDFQTNLYGGIGYIRQLKGKNRIVISLVKNLGLSDIGDGSVRALADNNLVFQSNFKHASDFTGLRVQYGYNVQKKERPAAPPDGRIRHSIFGEFFGAGGLASLNYDRRFKPGNSGLGARIGAGSGWLYSTDDVEGARYVTFPAMVNYIIGKGRSELKEASESLLQ